MSSDLLENTPQDESQNSNGSQTQTFEPSEQSESVWGRLIPVSANHEEASLNQVFELSEALVTLGRDSQSDILLKCSNISSSHCKLTCNSDDGLTTVFLEDTSTNGTWINKQRISKKKVLINDGCEIILIPPSKKKKRKKLSYFFHLERGDYSRRRRINSSATSVESKYYIIKDLGSGAFSTVKLVQDRSNNNKYALKIIDRIAWQRMKHATKRNVTLLDEVEIMKKTNHKHIVKVYEYFEEETKVNVILDFCGGGDMLEYIQKNGAYSSEKARKIFKQLIESVDYLHSLSIAHRDLKPDNILLTDSNGDTIKISDFGISREVTSSGCGTIIGTPLYQAPEVHNNLHGYNGTLADYWSLGIILYVMLVAAPPISTQETTAKICEMSVKRALPWYDEPIPETAKDLIYKLLCVDPKNRITAKNIYLHPWIIGYDNLDDIAKDKNNNNNHNIDCKEEEELTQNGEEFMDMDITMKQSRKRKADFDEDIYNETPTKKQRTDPKQIQNEDITIPLDLTRSDSI